MSSSKTISSPSFCVVNLHRFVVTFYYIITSPTIFTVVCVTGNEHTTSLEPLLQHGYFTKALADLYIYVSLLLPSTQSKKKHVTDSLRVISKARASLF